MTFEIVDFPIENGDVPVRYVSHYQARYSSSHIQWENLGHPLLSSGRHGWLEAMDHRFVGDVPDR